MSWQNKPLTKCFNTQPHEGGCLRCQQFICDLVTVSTHSRTKAAADTPYFWESVFIVSTHSRTKAAAFLIPYQFITNKGFNTQPHEGGCNSSLLTVPFKLSFNTQPHEGGCLLIYIEPAIAAALVSTHSRTKAAARAE